MFSFSLLFSVASLTPHPHYTCAGFLDPAERLPSADDRSHDLQQRRAVQHHPERGFRGNYTSVRVCVATLACFPLVLRSGGGRRWENLKNATNAEIWWHFWEHVITCAEVTVVFAKGWMFANYDPGSGCLCFDCHTFVEFASRESWTCAVWLPDCWQPDFKHFKHIKSSVFRILENIYLLLMCSVFQIIAYKMLQ